MMYDYLIVGAGLFGSVCAYELQKAGFSVCVVDRRPRIGGNVYTETYNDIVIHRYGAHIFRTNDDQIWQYVNKFAEFRPFINSPIAIYKDEVYNLPFNMNTFNKLWGVKTPEEALEVIRRQQVPIKSPKNLEEFVLSTVGRDIYEKLIKGYTEKQWNRPCTELSPDIIKRIPLRFTYDNNYSANCKYQGIPIGGYTNIISQLLKNVEVKLGIEGKTFVRTYSSTVGKIIYSGCIDEFFEYSLGKLEYRSLRFVDDVLPINNYQGNAVVNYTDVDVPYTRIIEHKHFEAKDVSGTIITREYPATQGEPFYPVINATTKDLYNKYVNMAKKVTPKISFVGRLGSYQYVDMDETIDNALQLSAKLIAENKGGK